MPGSGASGLGEVLLATESPLTPRSARPLDTEVGGAQSGLRWGSPVEDESDEGAGEKGGCCSRMLSALTRILRFLAVFGMLALLVGGTIATGVWMYAALDATCTSGDGSAAAGTGSASAARAWLENLLGASALMVRFGGFAFALAQSLLIGLVRYKGASLPQVVLAPRKAPVISRAVSDAREDPGWDPCRRRRAGRRSWAATEHPRRGQPRARRWA